MSVDTSEDRIEAAIETSDPLFGTAGFAGELSDGRLVRDVLGREPLFLDTETGRWQFRPADQTGMERLPAGCCYSEGSIRRVWTLPDPDPVSEHTGAIDSVRQAIRTTVTNLDEDGLAVAFSGGVDSSVVAAAVDAPLYVVGLPDSHDVNAAKSAATHLGRELRVVELSLETIEAAVPDVVATTGRTDPMDVQIAVPLYLLAERVAADGYDRVALGQGADELFGGYQKMVEPADDHRIEATTVRGARRELLESLPAQLERDVLAIRGGGVEPVTPLLHDRVVTAGLELPGSLLVGEETRKTGFRRAARAFVPDTLATREKKALQYGSLAARELDRLARQDGFKRRMDHHIEQYIRSRVE